MNLQARKILIIEECLKVKSSNVLHEIEAALKKAKRKGQKKNNVYDFLGIWNEKESAEIKKVILETSEQIA